MVFQRCNDNLYNSIKAKPPFVVFTLCLAAIAIATFSLAYYVQSTDNILNTDAKEDWISLLKYLQQLQICAHPQSALKAHAHAQHDHGENIVSVTTFAFVSLPHLKGNATVAGHLTIADWASNCPDKDVPNQLHVSFNYIEHMRNTCIVLSGPKAFMPRISAQINCKPHAAIQTWANLTSMAAEDATEDFCKSMYKGSIAYDVEHARNAEFNMFLTQEEKKAIISHLILTSCFVSIVVFLIVLYSALKKRTYPNGCESSKHLMGRGMY